MADEPVWSPRDHIDRVYERGYQLRRRRSRLVVAAPIAVVATLVLTAAVVSAGGGSSPSRRLHLANRPVTTTTSVADGSGGTATPSTVVGPLGSVVAGPATTNPPGRGTSPPKAGSSSTTRPAAVTTVAAAPSTTRPRGTSGVTGTVMFGPQCPVQRPDQPCPDKPGPADITLSRGDGTVVGKGSAGQDGRFSIKAAPGTYTVTASTGSRMGGCQPTQATVTAGHWTDVTVQCDTGIR